jgi:hypothetical protein
MYTRQDNLSEPCLLVVGKRRTREIAKEISL